MIAAATTLNADQLRAVEHQGGPLLVLAGPGTGKTGVLEERISHLVAGQGVSPERILAMKGDPPKPERATGNGAVRMPASDFATSEYTLKASSYPLHEGADLPEQGPARIVEVSFAIEVGGSEVRGRIDAVFLDADGTVHLIDWKTGRPHESYKRRLQLPLYALAANRLWSVEPERMRLAYVFVPGSERVEVEVGEGFLGSAEQRVVNALNTIRSGAYDPSPSHHACSYCPVIGVEIKGCPTEVPEP
jgi:DNA helicase II / ATP-dependent DNA helicase PcrA